MLIAHNKFNQRKLSIPTDDLEIVGVQHGVPGSLYVFFQYTDHNYMRYHLSKNMFSVLKKYCAMPYLSLLSGTSKMFC